MKVILCADQKNGLMFNHRRQSQDRELRKRILSIIGDGKLYASAYSAGQFTEDLWEGKLEVCEELLAAAALQPCPSGRDNRSGRDVYYFAEGQALQPAAEAGVIEAVILYRWDKVYPADTWLDLPRAWQLTACETFAGYSHEQITEEIYRPV